MRLGGTAFHRLLRSPNLFAFLPLGLHEHSEENDPPARCNPVCDPSRPARHIEPKLSKLAVQLSSVGFIECGTKLSESVNVEANAICVLDVQTQEPLTNFWFKLNVTPHSAYAILSDQGHESERARTRQLNLRTSMRREKRPLPASAVG